MVTSAATPVPTLLLTPATLFVACFVALLPQPATLLPLRCSVGPLFVGRTVTRLAQRLAQPAALDVDAFLLEVLEEELPQLSPARVVEVVEHSLVGQIFVHRSPEPTRPADLDSLLSQKAGQGMRHTMRMSGPIQGLRRALGRCQIADAVHLFAVDDVSIDEVLDDVVELVDHSCGKVLHVESGRLEQGYPVSFAFRRTDRSGRHGHQ